MTNDGSEESRVEDESSKKKSAQGKRIVPFSEGSEDRQPGVAVDGVLSTAEGRGREDVHSDSGGEIEC